MTGERYLKTIIYAAALVWAALLYFNHEAIKSAWLAPLSNATAFVMYAVVGFDFLFWKQRFLHGWFVKRPVIDGTWKVEIRSNWAGPATGAVIPPIEGYMVARQTFSTLSLRLLTAESSSELVGTEIVCTPDGLYCVSGVYRNEPRFQVRDRSPIHYGAVWLKIMDDDPEKSDRPLLDGSRNGRRSGIEQPAEKEIPKLPCCAPILSKDGGHTMTKADVLAVLQSMTAELRPSESFS